MNIYLVEQDVNNGYDTYDSFVVVAESEEIAKHTSPSGFYVWKNEVWNFCYSDGTCEPSSQLDWCLPSDVKVTLIGEADKKYTETTVLLASFNAG